MQFKSSFSDASPTHSRHTSPAHSKEPSPAGKAFTPVLSTASRKREQKIISVKSTAPAELNPLNQVEMTRIQQ